MSVIGMYQQLRTVRSWLRTSAIAHPRTQLFETSCPTPTVAEPNRFHGVFGSHVEESHNVRVASSALLIVDETPFPRSPSEYQTFGGQRWIINDIPYLKVLPRIGHQQPRPTLFDKQSKHRCGQISHVVDDRETTVQKLLRCYRRQLARWKLHLGSVTEGRIFTLP